MKRQLVLTTPHMKGEDVEWAQRLLHKEHYYKGELDGDFGTITAQASYRAQYWLGYATPKLAFGTKLEQLLAGTSEPTQAAQTRIAQRTQKQQQQRRLREAALHEMQKLIGVAEEPPGSNHVPEVNSWWGGGDAPWCARAVSKAYVNAGSKGFVRGRNYENVPRLVGDARAGRNGLTVTLDPEPGDLVCYDWDGSNFATDQNHVGMFNTGTNASFTTIEGNVDSRCAEHQRNSQSAPRIVFVHVSR